MFKESIEQVIRCHVADRDMWSDVWQEICVRLVKDNYRLLREQEKEKRSLGVLVLMLSEAAARDFQRALHGRKRLPEHIKSLPALAQEVYRRLYWNNSSGDADSLAEELRHFTPPPTPADIAGALELVRANLPAGHSPASLVRAKLVRAKLIRQNGSASISANPERVEECSSPMPTPEDAACMQQQMALLRQAISGLPRQARQCLQLELISDLTPGEIARLMGLRVEYVYKIRQRALERIRKEFPGLPRKESSTNDRQALARAAQGGAGR
jgi:RNA polymerase sigma factor (sigma-70 family)